MDGIVVFNVPLDTL